MFEPWDNYPTSIMGELIEHVFGRSFRTNALCYKHWQDKEAVYLLIEVPGMTPKVTVEDDRLTIEAHREEEVAEGTTLLHEGLQQSKSLTLTIPGDYDMDAITAHAKGDGMLEVRIPRHKEKVAENVRVVEIQSK